MTHADDIVARLDALFESERDALLKGRLSEIQSVSDEKEQLFDALAASRPTPADAGPWLAHLRDKAIRNERLLDASMEGLRAAQARLTSLRERPEGFRTYDASGRQCDLPDRSASVIRHA